MAERADLIVFQGDDYAGTVTVTVDDDTPPEDILIGYTARAQIREGLADQYPNRVLAEIITTVQSPFIFLNIPHDVTTLLCGDKMCWDLQVADADGMITTLLAGRVIASPEVTRYQAQLLPHER